MSKEWIYKPNKGDHSSQFGLEPNGFERTVEEKINFKEQLKNEIKEFIDSKLHIGDVRNIDVFTIFIEILKEIKLKNGR